MQTVRTSNMGEIRLDGFPGRIFPFEPFLNHFFHYGNVVYVPEKTVHLNHILQCQPDHGKSFFHIIKGTIDLFLNRAADIVDTITQETIITCFYKPGVIPFFMYFISFNFTHTFSPNSVLS